MHIHSSHIGISLPTGGHHSTPSTDRALAERAAAERSAKDPRRMPSRSITQLDDSFTLSEISIFGLPVDPDSAYLRGRDQYPTNPAATDPTRA